MATAMPDPVWHCTSCGQEHFSWQITCADCSEFASVVWAPLKRKAPLVALPPELADQSADEEADDDEVMLLTDEAEEPKPPKKP
jgi:predicted ATP-dependent serine protease